MSFNSTMVRLKAAERGQCDRSTVQGFNSTMVRLKAEHVKSFQLCFPFRFQFHNGSIKRAHETAHWNEAVAVSIPQWFD